MPRKFNYYPKIDILTSIGYKFMMKSLIAVSLLVAGLSIVTFTQAAEIPVPINQENDHFINSAFSKVPEPSEMRLLSQQEMKETQGALGPIVAAVVRGTLMGAGGQLYENIKHDQPLDNGMVYAATVGAIGGAAAGKLVQLSGGGWAGNVAWQPGIVAVGQGVQLANPADQQYRNDHQHQW
jgi:hypothetical protein